MLDDHGDLAIRIRRDGGSAQFGGDVRLGTALELRGVPLPFVAVWFINRWIYIQEAVGL